MSGSQITLTASVHPLAFGRDDAENVASVRLDVTAPPDAPARPLNLGLVIDRSGSMSGHKLETARSAAARIVERLADEDIVTVVAFSTRAEAIVKATRLRTGRREVLEKLRGITALDETNVALGLELARAELAAHVRPDTVSAIFLVTDGQASDGEQALALVSGFGSQRILLYAAGIGADYNHEYIGKLCGKNRADHVDADGLDRMHAMFDEFLRREGHLVTADGRLTVDPGPGVRLRQVTSAEERGLPIAVDGRRSLAVRDLPAGGRQSFLFEFLLTPSAVGPRPLAEFRLTYSLPAAGAGGREAVAATRVEVTDDPSRAQAPNGEVLKLHGQLRAVRLSDKAEADIANQQIDAAVAKLGRVTKELRDLGQNEIADQMEQKARELAASSPEQRNLLVKQIRGTTKMLAQSDQPGRPAGGS